jgi:hypothetical protein
MWRHLKTLNVFYQMCQSGKTIPYVSLAIWHSGKAKLVSGCQGGGRGERWVSRKHRICKATKLLYMDTVMMNTCHHILLKTYGMYNMKREP